MYADMDAVDLAEWEVAYQEEPWGDHRADLRAGIVASAVVSPYVKKGRPAPQPQDFMTFMEKKQQSEEDMKATIERWMKRVNNE